MSYTQKDCERVLASMFCKQQAIFLARLGHYLSVVGREAYEFQGPGITNRRWLRDLNEVHHRIYSQIGSLTAEEIKGFPAGALASWLSGEGKSEEFQSACLNAFEKCHQLSVDI